MVRLKVTTVPARNHLDVLSKSPGARWIRVNSDGMHVLLIEVIQQTARELLTLTPIDSGYVVLRIKGVVDGAGNYSIWRDLQSNDVDMDDMLTTALI